MALSFLNRDVSDLSLGKPALRPVKADSSVAEAVAELKRSGESHVSVWSSSDHSRNAGSDDNCRCIGKICMIDVIVFLCKEENSGNPSMALQTPVSQILPSPVQIVRHLNSNSSLQEAIDCILEGSQNLVIPIKNKTTSNNPRRKLLPSSLSSTTNHHANGTEYCWLSQEDIVRFLLNSIGLFTPLPTFTIESLNIIDYDIMAVGYNDLATSALGFISRANLEQTSVAVVDDDNRLIGEISPATFANCDESVAAAVASLSAGDLMAYIDCGGPTEDMLELAKMRLEEKNLMALLGLMEEEYSAFSSSSSSSSLSTTSSCSSDDELGLSRNSVLGRFFTRRTEAITCYRWSSLAAVMVQALAHRASNVWVIEEDQSLVGIVTYKEILRVFRNIANPRPKPAGWDSNSSLLSAKLTKN